MLWQISLRYLSSHKRQTLVCVAGVTISVMMFLAMYSMMKGFRDKFIVETVESSGHIVINDEPRESQTPILQLAYPEPNALLLLDRIKPRDQVKKIKNPQGLIAKLRQLPHVVAVGPEVTGDAIATYGTKTMTLSILGVEPEEQQKVTTIGEKLLEGNFARLRATADGVVIGHGVALVLGAKLGDSINLSSSTGGRTIARVVGIFQTGVTPVDYSRAYMLLNNAQTLLDKKNIINRLTLRTDDYAQAPAYAAQIESMVGYKTESWQESNANFLKIFAIQDVITFIITGALMVVAAFGVLNILIMAVMERVNDIAILKSFGFSRRDITWIFVNQGLLIGVTGAGLGLAVGKLFIEILRRLPVHMEGLVKAEGLLMSEYRGQYVMAFVAALAVTLIASVYPARRAASYDPVEVIRGAH
ncbi:MAG: ABC transporter permease [Phycisphaeraceae bacterium]|nr:ABC transporter permease [Phycisphaeraceae bacterium]